MATSYHLIPISLLHKTGFSQLKYSLIFQVKVKLKCQYCHSLYYRKLRHSTTKKGHDTNLAGKEEEFLP